MNLNFRKSKIVKGCIACFLCLFFNLSAQTLTEAEVVFENKKLLNFKKNGTAENNCSVSVLFNGDTIHIDSVHTIYDSSGNYSATGGDKHANFSLVRNGKEYYGILIDEKSGQSFEILTNEKGKIALKETPKNELIFECEFNGNKHKHNNLPKLKNYILESKAEDDVLRLQSKPGAQRVIYLDFDGEPGHLSGWWNNNDYLPVDAGISNDFIRKAWKHVSEDFAAFDVNITTDSVVYKKTPIYQSAWVVFATFPGSNNWFGKAKLNSWGTLAPCLVRVPINPQWYFDYGTTASHEIGHMFGLKHHGTQGDEYYDGHGEWSPIMGAGKETVSTWCKGDYAGASRPNQDDIAMILQKLPPAVDDNPNFKYVSFDSNGDLFPYLHTGIIESRYDIDRFRLEMPVNGDISITAANEITDPSLDIKLSLINKFGIAIASDAPVGDRTATITMSLAPGTYYLVVDGAGELDVNTGWTDYSSIGGYKLSGNVTFTENIDYDITIEELTGVEETCNKSISPSIKVLNKGENAISSIEVETYIDDVLVDSKTFSSLTLTKGQSQILNLNSISNSGNHVAKFKVILPTVTETFTLNNLIEKSFKLTYGSEIKFTTDYLSFNAGERFNWRITDTSNTETFAVSDVISIDNSDPNIVSQSFCLASGCYDIHFYNEFDQCSSFPAYKQGLSYIVDYKVVHNGVIYSPVYLASTEPPSSEWITHGPCKESVNYNYKLTNESESTEYFSNFTDDFVDNFRKERFCVSYPTSVKSKDNSYDVLVYPNPASNRLSVSASTKMESVNIYNSLGQIVNTYRLNSKKFSIDISDLKPGIYTLTSLQNGNRVSKNFLVLK